MALAWALVLHHHHQGHQLLLLSTHYGPGALYGFPQLSWAQRPHEINVIINHFPDENTETSRNAAPNCQLIWGGAAVETQA